MNKNRKIEKMSGLTLLCVNRNISIVSVINVQRVLRSKKSKNLLRSI
jgi:hypothetical protein